MNLYACTLVVFTWTTVCANALDLNVSPGYKSLWKPNAGKKGPTGIEFGEISRGALLKLIAEFTQNVEERLRPRNERVRFTAQFANNKYTKPFIYPRFFGG